jgi:hypothetical protein
MIHIHLLAGKWEKFCNNKMPSKNARENKRMEITLFKEKKNMKLNFWGRQGSTLTQTLSRCEH